jgi:type IV secretion system protein VirB5
MKQAKKGLLTIAAAAWVVATDPADAAMAVVDAGAIAQLVKQISTLQQQLETARNQLTQVQRQYQAMTGARGMDRLLAGTMRNYLPPDWQALEAAVNGIQGGYAALAAQLDATLEANAVLTADQVGQLSASERAQLEAARRSAALMQVTSKQALATSSQRFASLQQFIDAIPGATDQKAVLDLQARIAAEQAMLQNEHTKLMVLYQAAQAEELARKQRAQELAIANRGSLRSLGPIGLND